MAALRECENPVASHFTDDMLEMFCECGFGFKPKGVIAARRIAEFFREVRHHCIEQW